MSGSFTWGNALTLLGLAVTVWRVIVQNHLIARLRAEHKTHTRQITALQTMHYGTVADHPPEPSPGESR